MKSGIDLCMHSYRPGRHVHAYAHNRSGEHLMSCHLTATYILQESPLGAGQLGWRFRRREGPVLGPACA